MWCLILILNFIECETTNRLVTYTSGHSQRWLTHGTALELRSCPEYVEYHPACWRMGRKHRPESSWACALFLMSLSIATWPYGPDSSFLCFSKGLKPASPQSTSRPWALDGESTTGSSCSAVPIQLLELRSCQILCLSCWRRPFLDHPVSSSVSQSNKSLLVP